MADLDAALMQEVFDVPKPKREPDIHHDRELDDLGRCLVAKWVLGHLPTPGGSAYRLNLSVPLTIPSKPTLREKYRDAAKMLQRVR
jgi:hypothetical protein